MAGIIKRFLGHLGLFKDENNEKQQPTVNSNATPSKGFSVKLEVPTGVVPQGPVVCQCFSGDGGVQGFRWYSQKLQVDEDGDIAEEFLDEVVPEITGPGDSREAPSFKVKGVLSALSMRFSQPPSPFVEVNCRSPDSMANNYDDDVLMLVRILIIGLHLARSAMSSPPHPQWKGCRYIPCSILCNWTELHDIKALFAAAWCIFYTGLCPS